jgi:DNA (cytosine-5)-methyltransferase 1
VTTRGVPSTPLRVLDLFAGAGGLSEGLHQTGGFNTVMAVEMDRHAAATFSLNHPATELFVGPIEEWLSIGHVPQIDVIIGGPPCQGFSTLGKQDVQDDRNALWKEYARAIVRAEPTYFVVENVAAFVKSPQFEQFHAETQPGGMLQEFAFQAAVMNAADYGAFQARRRAVMIGHRRDVPFPGWPTPTHLGNPRTVREAFSEVTRKPTRDLPLRTLTFDGAEISGPFTSCELHVGREYTDTSLARFAHIPEGGNRFDIPYHLLAPCWRKHTSGSGDVMGRLHWERPSVTIRTEFFKPEKGRYLHPDEDRAITHFEATLLQGFPQSYQWAGSRTSIARQIGNAVPIPLGRAIGWQLLAGARTPPRPGTARRRTARS